MSNILNCPDTKPVLGLEASGFRSHWLPGMINTHPGKTSFYSSLQAIEKLSHLCNFSVEMKICHIYLTSCTDFEPGLKIQPVTLPLPRIFKGYLCKKAALRNLLKLLQHSSVQLCFCCKTSLPSSFLCTLLSTTKPCQVCYLTSCHLFLDKERIMCMPA